VENLSAELHPDLAAHVVKKGRWLWLHHPLVICVLDSDEIALANRQYTEKASEIDRALRNKSFETYVNLHERPYRLSAFLEVMDRLDDQRYWSLLGEIWTDSENIHQDRRDWRFVLSSKRSSRLSIMKEEEVEEFRRLPDQVTVFRGTRYKSSVRGLSWTLDKDRAKWFANRFDYRGDAGFLAAATVAKCRVLAFFSGRDEAELVFIPKRTDRIEVVTFEGADNATGTPIVDRP
jgi:hypothetical protein